jgi:hypothetical protein
MLIFRRFSRASDHSNQEKSMLKRMLLLSLTVASLLIFHTVRVEALPVISVGTRIDISPTVFVVPIEITDGENVIFWQFDLVYDPTDVQIYTGCDPFSGDPYCDLFNGPITEGEFFSSLSPFNVFNPGFITLDPATFDQAGLLLAVNDTFGGGLPDPSGNGVLAYVEFLVIGDGTSPITVENASVTSSAAVPEPATLLLMTGGLLLLGAGRISRRIRGKNS